MSLFHHATVLDVPDADGRLKVRVADHHGERALWAWPLVGDPRAGAPALGTTGWVIFEQDDAERALWLGMLPR